jgi:hypothetical protein
MTQGLLHAHSGLRYLVLLAGLLAILYALYGLATRRPFDKPGRILATAYIGLVDLQVLLGLVLLVLWPYYPALIGHIVMMVLAAAVAHGAQVANRKKAVPGFALPLAGVAGSLLLIVGGILSIGKRLLGSGAMGS